MGAAVSIGILEGVDKSWPWPWPDGNFASSHPRAEHPMVLGLVFPLLSPADSTSPTAADCRRSADTCWSSSRRLPSDRALDKTSCKQTTGAETPNVSFHCSKSLSSDIDTHRSPEVWGSSTWHVKINKQSSKSQALTCFSPFALPDFTVSGPIHVPP